MFVSECSFFCNCRHRLYSPGLELCLGQPEGNHISQGLQGTLSLHVPYFLPTYADFVALAWCCCSQVRGGDGMGRVGCRAEAEVRKAWGGKMMENEDWKIGSVI